MKNKEILEKAIEKAVKNGFDDGGGFIFDFATYHNCPESFIFSHSFAKAFWGERNENGRQIWKWHLTKMVLEEEPLKYIEKFLDENK